MSSREQLAHHWRRHRAPLLPMAVGLMLMELGITMIAPDPDQAGMFRSFLGLAPRPIMRIFSEELVASTTAKGLIATGYAHPFVLLLLSAWAIRVPAAALAGEIGRGTMDLLAARPVARVTHVLAALVATLGGLVVLCGALWAGTALGIATRPRLGLSVWDYLEVAAIEWLLFAAFAAVSLLVSACRSEGGSVIAWMSGIVATSFVLDYMSRLWTAIAALRPYSLFRYFQPHRFLESGGAAALSVRVFTAVFAVALLGSILVFRRRDL